MTAYNKIVFTSEQHDFLRANFNKLTNSQIAEALGLRLTRVRYELYSLGLYKIKLQMWTPEQVDFLKDNYKAIGDSELAELFSDRWEKAKGWNKRHIEKKRRYLKLKRTTQEIKDIHSRNVENKRFSMCASNMWKTRGCNTIGTVVLWSVKNRKVPLIKTIEGYVHLNVHIWRTQKGEIPKGMNVVRIDGNPLNCKIENLKLVTDAELQAINAEKRANKPHELKEVEKLINKINKKIKKYGTQQNERS